MSRYISGLAKGHSIQKSSVSRKGRPWGLSVVNPTLLDLCIQISVSAFKAFWQLNSLPNYPNFKKNPESDGFDNIVGESRKC